MLNARLYRAALVPVAIALAIASFSLGPRPLPHSSTLAPDAFQGERAFAELQSLAATFPQRRPGSAGDERMAQQIAATLHGLGGAAGGGFSVRVQHSEGQTIDGKRAHHHRHRRTPGLDQRDTDRDRRAPRRGGARQRG